MVNQVITVAALPWPARLEVSYPDPFTVYDFSSVAPLYYHYEPEAWLRGLPLTGAQAGFLMAVPGRHVDMMRWPPPWDRSAPDRCIADVQLTIDEAARIAGHEPWETVLGLNVPLMVVARNEEEQ